MAPETSRKVRDLVIDRLQGAGNAGTKASDIRKFVQSTIGTTIHPKTAGMTRTGSPKRTRPLLVEKGKFGFSFPRKRKRETPALTRRGRLTHQHNRRQCTMWHIVGRRVQAPWGVWGALLPRPLASYTLGR